MTGTMRAVVLDAPGPSDALQIRELPIPEARSCVASARRLKSSSNLGTGLTSGRGRANLGGASER
jgi:hypothetical protein